MEKRIIIIGAGPCGLGAAYRLKELGYKNWAIYEKNDFVGGLSSSVKDKKGFTWDMGGHVIFSHYDYFDKIVDNLLKKEYVEHERKAYINCFDNWVPYPFQNNIRYLPEDAMLECVLGLVNKKNNNSVNFKQWIIDTFGLGIAKYFLLPQNLKTWAWPLDKMNKDWITERVSLVDIKKVLANIIYAKDDISWGPNNKFKFPLYGGTGGLFDKFRYLIKENIFLGKNIVAIDTAKRKVLMEDGGKDDYDVLINTSPLDRFIGMLKPRRNNLFSAAALLKHNSTYVVGIGLRGKCNSSKCWMYFPENKTPCYRITYFSNYSKYNVPDHKLYWSLLCETAYSKYKAVNRNTVVDDTIKGLIATGLISKEDRKKIVSAHLIDIEYSYPIPTLKRDNVLRSIMPLLEKNSIYSKGRFGAWLYEIGNMDHSLMQGVETVDKIVSDKK